MSNDKELVSIIVPVYNVESYIEKCFNSLVNQTYQNIEIISVNDGSTDRSGKICDKYALADERIQVIHKVNGGLSDARNAGLDVATGKFIMFVDSDDYLEEDAVEHLVEIARSTNSKIVQMKCYLIASNYTVIENQSTNTKGVVIFDSHEYIKGMCEKRYSESVCDKLFEASLFQSRRFEKGRLNEDFLFLSKLLLERFSVTTIDYAGYNYYQRPKSITHTIFGKSLLDAIENAYELMGFAREHAPFLEKDFARLMLFQIRTAFITMPREHSKGNSEVYRRIYQRLHENRHFILASSLSRSDKMLLFMVDWFPQPTLFMVSNMWKLKQRLKLK